MGGKNTTTTQKTELPPDIVAAYDKLLTQAQPVAATPYQPYQGGFTPEQTAGFGTIGNLNGASNGYFGGAGNAYTTAANDYSDSMRPAYQRVSSFMNPYIQSVVKAATGNMQEQNAEQQQGVVGNAAAQGALGGNRVGVAQSELARQQDLANNQNISNILEQGYGQALTAAQAQQQYEQQAGQGMSQVGQGLGQLGQTYMQTNLAQAAAEVGAGTQQQQWDYQQYQNERSYPFQTTSWLANIVEGLGSGRGTTTTTQPSGNSGSSVLGGILSLASLFDKGGAVHARPHRAVGGIIPYSGPSGIADYTGSFPGVPTGPGVTANNNQPPAANDNGGYVPQAQQGVAGPAHPAPVQPQPDQGQAMLNQGIQAEEKSLKARFPNGILAGSPAPQQGPTLSGAPLGAPPVAPAAGGLLSKLGGLFGLANGGVARGHYDDGGYVDPTDSINNIIPVSAYDSVTPIAAMNGVTPSAWAQMTPAQRNLYAAHAPLPAVQPSPARASSVGPDVYGTQLQMPAPPNIGYQNTMPNVPIPGVAPQGPQAAADAAKPSGGIVPVEEIPTPTARPDMKNDFPAPGAPVPIPPFDNQVVAGGPLQLPTGGAIPLPQARPGGVAGGGTGTGNGYFPPAPQPPAQQTGGPSIAANAPLVSANQPIYDRFMNASRAGYTDGNGVHHPGITSPYGLAALASTGYHESGFSAQNANGTWRDPSATNPNAMAGGILSLNGPRLAAMRAANGGSNGTPEQQSQYFQRENPALITALNNAKSLPEAMNLINGNIRFAGWNQPSGEAQRRYAQAARLLPTFQNSSAAPTTATANINPGPQGDGPGPTMDSAAGVSGNTSGTGVSSTAAPVPHTSTLGGTGINSATGQPGPNGVGGMLGGTGQHHFLNLSDDQRMALLSAGLGMMAGTSPHFAQNVGTGGLKGLEQWKTNQELNRQNADTASNINYRQGSLGLEGQRLGIEAQRAAGDIALETAQAAHENLETGAGRWDVQTNPAGLIVRDRLHPENTRLIPIEQLLQNGAAGGAGGTGTGAVTGGSNEGVGAAVGNGGTGSTAAPATAPVAPSRAPVTAAPTTPVGAPGSSGTAPAAPNAAPQQQQQSQMIPTPWEPITKAPKLPMDNRIWFGADGVKREADREVENAQGQAHAAQQAQIQLEETKRDLADLQGPGLLTEGTGQGSRLGFAKAVNTAAQIIGMPGFDEQDVAASEDLNKQTFRLGAALSNTMGSREAEGIVNQAIAAVPNGANSKEGARRIIAGIEAANAQKLDYYQYLQDFQGKNSTSTKDARASFDKLNPPEKYVERAMLGIATVPHAVGDIKDAKPGTMFNVNGQLVVPKKGEDPVQKVTAAAAVPRTQADIDGAQPGTIFNINGKLMVK